MHVVDQRTVGSVGPRIFATTRWSVVIAAGEEASVPSERAMETLCRAYWQPIYIYIRRKGHGPGEAQDLTQEFFAQLISRQHVRRADRHKGKFRTFLLANLDFFLAREWNRAHRQKRGGQYTFLSLDEHLGESDQGFEPSHDDTPEKSFQRQWAVSVLKQTMKTLERDCLATGKERLFNEVKHLLSGERQGAGYTEIAQRLGMTESALRVAVHRLRHRYGELLRREIGQTVESPEEIEEELRCLSVALSQ